MFIINYSKQDHLLDNLIKLHYLEIQEFTIAPNDEEILLVLGNTDMPHEEYSYGECNRSIWKCDIQTGNVIKLTLLEEDAVAPSWSPDGKRIIYFSAASGKKEVWVMNQDGTNKRQLTVSEYKGRDPFNEAQIKWSPDGSSVVYTTLPNGSFYGLWQSIIKEQENSPSIQVENGENKRKIFYEDARKVFRSSLHILNVETGENKQIIPKSEHFLKIISWCPDGKHLLVKEGRDLVKIDPATLHKEKLYNGNFGLIHFTDTTLNSARIEDNKIVIGCIKDNQFMKKMEVKLNGHEPITLHTWANDGSKVYYTSQDGVSNILYSVNVQNGEVKVLTEKGKTVEDNPICTATAQSYHQQDAIIFPYSGPEEPIELWEANHLGDIRKISRICEEYKPKDVPKVEVISYESNGWDIESLLVLPKNYHSAKIYPTLIYLHGGPEDYVRANFSELISGRAENVAHYLADHGYVVLLPNFRGSSGYGEAFMHQLSHYKLMQAPYEDVIAGIDYLITSGIADPERLGIYGTSFGATLTAWTTSQTSRFKGAVGMVGIYDLLQIDRYINHSFHSIAENRSEGTIPKDLWFNPEVYKRISPMEHFEQIRTPMLFIETAAEREYNGSTAKPLFHALLTQKVKTNLVYYPEAFHNGGWNDRYKRDYMKRLVAWFDYCIKGIELPGWFE